MGAASIHTEDTAYTYTVLLDVSWSSGSYIMFTLSLVLFSKCGGLNDNDYHRHIHLHV